MISTEGNQREISWFRSRFGNFTGSEVHNLMKSGRKKDEVWSETAKSYMYKVAAERMFNPDFLNDDDVFEDYLHQTNFTSKAMQFGIEQEQYARETYIKLNNSVEVFEVASCKHDTIPHFAASPDGIVRGADLKCLEIKCPNIATHMMYVDKIHDGASLKEVKPEYYWQTMAEMACTGATETDFVSYSPWLMNPMHIVNIPRNDEDIALLEERVKLANAYVEEIINKSKS